MRTMKLLALSCAASALASCRDSTAPSAAPVSMSAAAIRDTTLAGSNCTFAIHGTTWALGGDCKTGLFINVPDGTTLDGRGHTISTDPAAAPLNWAAMISVAGSGVRVNVRNVVLEGLGASGAFFSGIQYSSGAEGKIENTQIGGFFSTGIQAFNSNVLMRRNVVRDNGTIGIQVTNGEYEIVHNSVSNHPSYGIELEGGLSNTRVMSNQLQGNGNGLWVGGSSASVSRNDVLQSHIRGIVAAVGSVQDVFTMNVVLGVGVSQPSCEDLGVGNEWVRNSSDSPSSPTEICPVR